MRRYIKKLVAFILCMTFILPTFVFSAGAEKTEYHRVEISVGDGVFAEKAILKNGDIFIPAESFSKYTRYEYDENNSSFAIKKQEFKKAFKALKLNADAKQVTVSGKKVITLSDCFTADGKVYLPFCQMLPLLDADIFGVNNGIIQVSNPTITMADILYNIDVTDIYFDYSKEFLDSEVLAGFYVVPAYIFDTVVNTRYDRLDVVSHSGEYNDYKEIFSELLAEDNLYLKAKAYSPDALDEMVASYKMIKGDQTRLHTLFDWVETASKTADSTKGGVLLDKLKEAHKLDEYQKNNLRGINSAWYAGKVNIGDCVSAVNYLCTYITMVEDNHKMLKTVYKTDGEIGSGEIDRKAAKHVCDLYGDNVEKALWDEIGLKFAEEVTEKVLSPIAIYAGTSKVIGLAFDGVLPYSYSDVARIPLYAEVISSARSVFNQSEMFTDRGAENKRLSLLLCLMASRKCFQIMAGASDYSSRDYYYQRVDVLENFIKLLYLVGNNTEFDSFEHFEDHYRANLEKIKGIEYEIYNTELPQNSIGNLTEIGYFERSSRAMSNISGKATTDGTYLFVVTDKGIERYGWNGTVGLTIPGNYSTVLYSDGILYAAGEDGLFTMDVHGENKNTCFTGGTGVLGEFCLWNGDIYYFATDMYGERNKLHRYSFNSGGYTWFTIKGHGFLATGPDELGIYETYPDSFEVWRNDPLRPLSAPWYDYSVGFGRLMSGNAFIETDGEVYYAYSTHGYAEERALYSYDIKGNEIGKVADGVYYDCVLRGNVLCLLGDTDGEEAHLMYYDMGEGKIIAESQETYSSARGISDVIGDYWFLDTVDGVEIVYFPSK